MVIDKMCIVERLSKIVGITEKHNIVPIIKNVKFKFGETISMMSATNLEVSAIIAMPGVAGGDDKELLLNGRLLLDIFKELNDGDVEIIDSDETIIIKQGKTLYKLAKESAEDFPEINGEIEKEDFMADFEVETKTLIGAIKKVEFAISQDESRYGLCGVRLTSRNGKLTAVATDGFRLSMVEKDLAVDFAGVTIPRKALANIYNVVGMGEKVRLVVGRKMVKFITSVSTLICRTIDAAYPVFEPIITVNGDHANAVVEKDAFMKAVKTVLIVADSKNKMLKVSFRKDNKLVLRADGTVGNAYETIPLEYEGEDVVLGFNGKYLQDILVNAIDKKIRLKVPKEPEIKLSSLFVLEDDAKALSLVMPLII